MVVVIGWVLWLLPSWCSAWQMQLQAPRQAHIWRKTTDHRLLIHRLTVVVGDQICNRKTYSANASDKLAQTSLNTYLHILYTYTYVCIFMHSSLHFVCIYVNISPTLLLSLHDAQCAFICSVSLQYSLSDLIFLLFYTPALLFGLQPYQC